MFVISNIQKKEMFLGKEEGLFPLANCHLSGTHGPPAVFPSSIHIHTIIKFPFSAHFQMVSTPNNLPCTFNL
jgi:hypothetical protein